MEFYHIRSHVNRAGTYIGNAKDGPRDRSSHLMILLFDCLLYNHQSLLHRPHTKRMEYLQRILPRPIPGRLEFVERVELDFAQGVAALDKMRSLFAAGIVKRWEGFVLKPLDEPYLNLAERRPDGNTRSYGWVGGKAAWVKLKKDYIQGCGDTGDFAIVGGAADRGRGWERRSQYLILQFLVLVFSLSDNNADDSEMRSAHRFPCWVFIKQGRCPKV